MSLQQGDNGAVGIVVSAVDSEVKDPSYCSGLLLANGIIATAKHCFTCETCTIEVSFGSNVGHWTVGADNCASPSVLQRAQVDRIHSTLDLALLSLADGVSPPENLAIDVAQSIPPVGTDVLLVGFGLSESGIGVRRYLRSKVSGLEGSMVDVDTDGNEGACEGDSGGPLLVRNAATETWQAVAILNEGASSCLGPDTYLSIVGLTDWIFGSP